MGFRFIYCIKYVAHERYEFGMCLVCAMWFVCACDSICYFCIFPIDDNQLKSKCGNGRFDGRDRNGIAIDFE